MNVVISSRAQALRLGRRAGHQAALDLQAGILTGKPYEFQDGDAAYNCWDYPADEAAAEVSARWRGVYRLAYWRSAAVVSTFLFARRFAAELLDDPEGYAERHAETEASLLDRHDMWPGQTNPRSWDGSARECLRPIRDRAASREIDAATEVFVTTFCRLMADHCSGESELAGSSEAHDDRWCERMLEDRLDR